MELPWKIRYRDWCERVIELTAEPGFAQISQVDYLHPFDNFDDGASAEEFVRLLKIDSRLGEAMKKDYRKVLDDIACALAGDSDKEKDFTPSEKSAIETLEKAGFLKRDPCGDGWSHTVTLPD
jgi:hypothetical protein